MKLKISYLVFGFLILLFILAIDLENDIIIYKDNWYDKQPNEDVRWMKNNGTLILVNRYNWDQIKLKFYSRTPNDRLVDLVVNDKVVDTFWGIKEGVVIHTPFISVEQGKNLIKFHSRENCVRNNVDTRCISFGIDDLILIEPSFVENENWNFVYSKNWYDKQPSEDVKWMKNNGTIQLFNFDKPTKRSIGFIGRSFYENKDVKIILNKNNIINVTIPHEGSNFFRINASLDVGENILEIYTPNECIYVNEVEEFEDFRCLSIGFSNIYFE